MFVRQSSALSDVSTSAINTRKRKHAPSTNPKAKKFKNLACLKTVSFESHELYCSSYFQEMVNTLFEDEEDYVIDSLYIENKPKPVQFKKIRKMLLSWIRPLVNKFHCSTETMFKLVYILDKFFSVKDVKNERIQLVGAVALSLANKYHNSYPIYFHRLVSLGGHSFTEDDIAKCEFEVFSALDYNITVPTCVTFLQLYLTQFTEEEYFKHLKRVSFYIAECLLLTEAYIGCKPSFHAAVSLYWGLQITANYGWTPRLESIIGKDEQTYVKHSKNLVDAVFPKFQLSGVQKVYFGKYSKIERTFRRRTLKDYVRKKASKYAK